MLPLRLGVFQSGNGIKPEAKMSLFDQNSGLGGDGYGWRRFAGLVCWRESLVQAMLNKREAEYWQRDRKSGPPPANELFRQRFGSMEIRLYWFRIEV